MTTTPRYFTLGRVAGTNLTRWAILDGRQVVEITVSRPDGVEIPRPEGVLIAPRPKPGDRGAAAAWQPSAYNNVTGDALAVARKRAGEKGARALRARRQQLMPGRTPDDHLAAARLRGGAKLQRHLAAQRALDKEAR